MKKSHGGFPTSYSNRWPAGLRRVLERNDFQIVSPKVRHYPALYYSAFLPLYLLNLVYSAIGKATKLESLASLVLIVPQKRG